jgi:putative phosphoesterase
MRATSGSPKCSPRSQQSLLSLPCAATSTAQNGRESIAETKTIEIGRIRLYLLHALQELDAKTAATGFDVIVSGHSHRASIERRGGVLYLNPGSAGPRRFKLPVTVAWLEVQGQTCAARIVELEG